MENTDKMRFKPEAISRVRKALKDDAAGNTICTMTDLDSACNMLDLLLEIHETKPVLSTQSFSNLFAALLKARRDYEVEQKENRRNYLIGFLQESFKKNGYGSVGISHEEAGEFIEDIKDAGFIVEIKDDPDPYESSEDSTYYEISIG